MRSYARTPRSTRVERWLSVVDRIWFRALTSSNSMICHPQNHRPLVKRLRSSMVMAFSTSAPRCCRRSRHAGPMSSNLSHRYSMRPSRVSTSPSWMAI